MPSTDSFPRLLHMGYYKAPPVDSVKAFAIPEGRTLVELITEGVVYFESDGVDRKFGCGALFWHVAGEHTVCRTEPKAPYQCITLAFTALPGVERAAPRLSLISDQLRTRELSQELTRAYHDDSVNRDALGRYAYARIIWEAHLGSIQSPLASRPEAVQIAVTFIEAEFRRSSIGTREIAQAAGLSEPHLYALFREHLKQTPHQFLNALRIREAKWLLNGTNHTIKSIALDCGFSNIETFYRAFKKLVGSTPHHFRQSHGVRMLSAF